MLRTKYNSRIKQDSVARIIVLVMVHIAQSEQYTVFGKQLIMLSQGLDDTNSLILKMLQTRNG